MHNKNKQTHMQMRSENFSNRYLKWFSFLIHLQEAMYIHEYCTEL